MNQRSSVLCPALMAIAILCKIAPAAEPRQLLQDQTVHAAMEFIRQGESETIEQQIRICEIPAPEFKESQRAAAVMQLLRDAHLQNVRIDSAGNVVADRPGKTLHPHLVVAAHLDTVFPEGTDVHVTRQGTLLKGPGIYDDCRGLATLVSVARALDRAGVQTTGSITFVADVGEEGLGDLRGTKELFAKTLHGQIDAFVSLDGPEGLDDVVNQGVGSYRYRLSYSGPGGHSFEAFGIANPVHALGRAIAMIDEMQVPASPKTTFNVGRIGGGTSVNTIASSAFAEIDMRSESMEPLQKENEAVKQAAQKALEDENHRWNNQGKLQMQLELLGFRPTGSTSENSPLVRTIYAVNDALDLKPNHLRAASTDSNLPMSLGIPAITIGGGGVGTGPHTVDESMDIKDAFVGEQRVLLLALSLVN